MEKKTHKRELKKSPCKKIISYKYSKDQSENSRIKSFHKNQVVNANSSLIKNTSPSNQIYHNLIQIKHLNIK